MREKIISIPYSEYKELIEVNNEVRKLCKGSGGLENVFIRTEHDFYKGCYNHSFYHIKDNEAIKLLLNELKIANDRAWEFEKKYNELYYTKTKKSFWP